MISCRLSLRARVAVAMTAIGLVLVGCGGTAADAPTSASSATEAATQRYTDSVGRTVTIPAHPQRIVSLHEWTSGEALLSIGAPLVGLTTRDGDFDKTATQGYDVSKVAKIGNIGEFNLEKIVALAPDLIVGSSVDGAATLPEAGQLSKFEAIAPVVLLSVEASLDEAMTAIGTISGMPEKIAAQKEEYESARATFLQKYQGKSTELSFTILGWFSPDVYVIAPTHESALVRLVVDLGLKFPPVTDKSEGGWATVSAEKMDEGSADIVLWSTPTGDPRELPLWNRLPAVAEGKASQLGYFPAANAYSTYERAIAELSPILDHADPNVVDESDWK